MSERVVEVPWALTHLPQRGRVLDVGSCEATYLAAIMHAERELFCIDPRDCSTDLPRGARFYRESILRSSLPEASFDAAVLLSTLEHVGMAHYEQAPFPHGDYLALMAVWTLLKADGLAIVTLPAGQSKLASWYRQYSPDDIRALFSPALWTVRELRFWGYAYGAYTEISPDQVGQYDYRDRIDTEQGAGAIAGIVAQRKP